jgi:excinuclease ABC subunit B
LGSPEYYRDITLGIERGEKVDRSGLIKKLVEMQYVRSDVLARGKFRLTGNTLEIMSPAREVVTRVEMENDKIIKIFDYDFLTGEELSQLPKTIIFPAKHFVVPEPQMEEALVEIQKELDERLEYLRKNGKILEAERLGRRTRQDLEMMREIGYTNGIENYSRYLTGRAAGVAPYTLIDYFPKDFLLVVDESHVTIPQLHGMFHGDYSRKKALIENGFRLPSAFDNRPLKFAEFEGKINQAIFTTATPADYEIEKSKKNSSLARNRERVEERVNRKMPDPTPSLSRVRDISPEYRREGKDIVGIVEQIIRPTGLIDPELVVKPAKGQVKDVMREIEKIVARKERVLITALTKKMAEDLAEFLAESKVKSEYLHSGVDTLSRIRVLEKLRRGEIEVLVGVNLLREGLDLPEVSLVAILDADKEGFLRSDTSLIQTIGRAARNVRGRVILYADTVTGSMKRAISETDRRRKIQAEYNRKHHITPKTIKKKIESIVDHELKPQVTRDFSRLENLEDLGGYIKQREKEMKDASRNLEFEKAAVIRDEIGELRKLQIK